LVRFLGSQSAPLSHARVAILGLTFKENISDIRNSRVPDILHELRNFGIEASVSDPLALADHVRHEYGLKLVSLEAYHDLDAIIFAVPHRAYLDLVPEILARLKPGGVFIDVKSALGPERVPEGVTYWSL
jgi:UDP-N-acetyl-D-galactosamine dehydrogenase